MQASETMEPSEDENGGKDFGPNCLKYTIRNFQCKF